MLAWKINMCLILLLFLFGCISAGIRGGTHKKIERYKYYKPNNEIDSLSLLFNTSKKGYYESLSEANSNRFVFFNNGIFNSWLTSIDTNGLTCDSPFMTHQPLYINTYGCFEIIGIDSIRGTYKAFYMRKEVFFEGKLFPKGDSLRIRIPKYNSDKIYLLTPCK